MRPRAAFLGAALVFITVFGVLTFTVAILSGVTVLTLVSLLVLGLLACGVVGALRHPPPEE